MKLTSILKYSLYNFVKRRPTEAKGTLLSLYKSRVFTGTELSDVLENKQAAQRWKEFLPYAYLANAEVAKAKRLVTSLSFNPESETLSISSIRINGLVHQQFNISNIIPLTYADMRAYNKLPQPQLPTYIDETMVYYNRFNQDTYVFEFDGSWNEETAGHPKLSLDARFEEKEWIDRRTAI